MTYIKGMMGTWVRRALTMRFESLNSNDLEFCTMHTFHGARKSYRLNILQSSLPFGHEPIGPGLRRTRHPHAISSGLAFAITVVACRSHCRTRAGTSWRRSLA